MKKAIITGGTGLIGQAVARHLAASGIEVLCLGRKAQDAGSQLQNIGQNFRYLNLPMEDFESLSNRLDETGWSAGEACVFFHFAWRGGQKLTDGGFALQMNNAIHAAQAVRVAKGIGCVKFVNAGTLEETYIEQHLRRRELATYSSPQADYGLAKLAARDMCKMIAYMERIDYVHTRLSVPLATDLSRGGYVAQTLKQIAKGEPYASPESTRLYDIISTNELARAYEKVGKLGRNKADYFIGCGRPATLAECFQRFSLQLSGVASSKDANTLESQNTEEFRLFSTDALFRETGFVAGTRFEESFQLRDTP